MLFPLTGNRFFSMKKLIILVLISFFISGSGSPHGNYNYFGRNGYRTAEIYHEIQSPLIYEKNKTASAARIVLGEINGLLYAVQPKNGELLWTFPVGRSQYRQVFPVYKNTVFLGRMDRWIFALNAANGNPVWRRFINEPIASSPLALDDSIIFPGDDLNTFFIDPANGDIKTKIYTKGSAYTPVFKNNYLMLTGFRSVRLYQRENGNLRLLWQKQYEENFDAPPYMSSKYVIVANASGKIFALSIRDGKQLWSFETRGNILSAPLYYKNRIYAGSTDGNIYCLDEINGKKLFEFPAGKAIIGNIIARERSIFFASRNGKLYCVDSERGFLKWEYFFGSRLINELYFNGDTLVLNSPDKCITLLSPISGSVIWKLESGVKHSEAEEENGRLFFTNNNGKTVQCFSLAQRKALWLKVLPEQQLYKPIIRKNDIAVAGANTLYFLNKKTGELLFTRNLRMDIREPIITDTSVYGFADSHVFKFNLLLNKMDWRTPVIGVVLKGLLLSNDTLYFGTTGGRIYALNAQNGSKRFEKNLGSQITSVPVISERVLYIGGYEGILYALNSINGAEIWKFKTFGEITVPPAIFREELYLVSRGHYVYRLNKKTGNKIWSTSVQTRFITPPIIFGNYLMAAGNTDILYFFNRNNGELRGEFFLGHEIEGSIKVAQDMIFYTLKSGSITILKKK